MVQLKDEEAVWDYLTELDKNIIQYTKSGAAAPNAVAMGEAIDFDAVWAASVKSDFVAKFEGAIAVKPAE